MKKNALKRIISLFLCIVMISDMGLQAFSAVETSGVEISNEETSGEEISNEETSGEEISKEEASGEEISEEEASGEEISKEEASGEEISEEEASGEEISEEEASGEEISEEEASGEEISEEEASGEEMSNEEASGEEMSNEEKAGDEISNEEKAGADTSNGETAADGATNDDTDVVIAANNDNTDVVSAANNDITDGDITNWAALQGAIINAEDDSTITLSQTLTAGEDDTRLSVPEGRSITIDLNGNTIDRNLEEVAADGSVFIVEKDSTLIITDTSADQDGRITGGNAEYGGGIYNKGTVTFEGGNISSNKATHGGAILNEGTLNMTGGCVENNEAEEGGGIYSNGNDPMDGSDKAKRIELTIKDGEIKNNNAAYSGGGIYIYSSYAEISGGFITENQAQNYHGGGIYVTGFGTVFHLSGGTINNNQAKMQGGGILVNESTGSVAVSGDLVVEDNTVDVENGADTDYAEQNIYIRANNAEQQKLTVSKALTEDARIGITLASDKGTFTSGYSSEMGESDPSQFFFSDKGYYVIPDSAGEAKISDKNNIIEVTSWDQLREAVSSKSEDTVKIRVMNPLTVSSGNAHNEGNTVEIDLNDYSIHGNDQQVFWNEKGTMTIKNGIIENAESDYGGAVNNRGTMTLKDINITDCKAKIGGGILNYGTLTMTGGSIKNCRAGRGGALRIVPHDSDHSEAAQAATAVLTNVEISGNSADGSGDTNGRGGAIGVSNGTLTMNGCSLTGNKSTNDDGGAIDFDAADKNLTLIDTVISDNSVTKSERQGGALNLERGTASISGCTITGNSAPDGGGIYINDAFELTEITGTTISSNTSTSYGGGGICAHSEVHIADDSEISGNISEGRGAGIWSDKDLEVENTTIDGNESKSESGGGIFVTGGTLTMTGGSIKNCKASRGGALRLIEGATATLTNVEISGNSVDGSGDNGRGGAIGVSGSTLTMTGCTLTGNKSTDDDGGAIDFDAAEKKLTLIDMTLSDNSVTKEDRQGGALNLERGTATISGCMITGNSAPDGGGIYISEDFGQTEITGTTVSNNESTTYGGGGICAHSNVSIKGKTEIAENKSKGDGAGIWSCADLEISDTQITGNVSNGDNANGGGICVISGTTILENVTVTDNQAKNSGGIYFNGASLKMQGKLIIKDNKINNLYLIKEKKITVTGKIDDSSWISVATDLQQRVITDGFTKNGNTNINVFSNDGGRQVSIDENGEVCFLEGESTGKGVFDRLTVTIHPKGQHYTLNIRDNGRTAGQNAVQLYNIGDTQRFWLTKADEESYYIDYFNGADDYSPSTKRFDIEDDDNYMKVGSIVHVVKGNQTAKNKRWKFIKNDDGSYCVQNMKSGLFWALNDDGYENKRKLCQKEFKDAEKWEIEIVAADGDVPIETLKEQYDSFTKTNGGARITSCNWMGHLSDDVHLSDISIPGTHDAATAHCLQAGVDPINASSQCQNMSIHDQLYNGIRYLDLRMEWKDNELKMVHGDQRIYCQFNGDDLTLDLVKEWIFTFLERNPTETVILQPKEDRGGEETRREIYKFFKKIAEEEPDKIYFFDGFSPKLRECRGKIVIFSRIGKFDGNYPNFDIDGKQWALDVHDWPRRRDTNSLNDPLGLATSGYYDVWDQDEYTEVGDDKWTLIYNSVFNTVTGAEAKRNSIRNEQGRDAWVVSYTSCTKITEIWHYPENNARDLNPRLKDMLMNDGTVLAGQFLGVVCSDFTDEQLAYLVYKQNFIGDTLTVKYSVVDGDYQSWSRENGGTCDFTIRRSIQDHNLYAMIRSVMVDGVEIDAYTVDKNEGASQDIYLHIDANYMETLSAGEHTLTVTFYDGRADCRFTRGADPPELNLFVGGVRVTEDNCSDVFGDGTVSFGYDKERAILTLNNAVIETNCRDDQNEQNVEYGIRYNMELDLNIYLVGDNKIVNKAVIGGNVTQEYGIRIYQAPFFTVSGEGSLEIDMPAENEKIYYVGINSRQKSYLNSGDIIINMPGTARAVGYDITYSNMLTLMGTMLKITVGSANGSYAMTNNRDAENLCVQDGSILEAESGYRVFNAQNQITEDTRSLGAIVDDGNGKAYWDGSTPLSSFKYIRIPDSDYVPRFTAFNLLLSSEIGLKIKVTLPDGVEADDSSYMEFVYSDGRIEDAQLINEADKVDGENAYWFTCFINPLEMEDIIDATFYYGTGQTIVDDFSAIGYARLARKVYPDRTKLITIVNALQNYAYYLKQSGWTDGLTHREIVCRQELTEADIETARAGVEGMQIVKELEGSGIRDLTFSLTLNSKTAINVFVQLEDGVTLVSPDPYETITEDGIKKYKFTTEKIGPRNLDKKYTFNIETSKGTAKVTASAMSYVYGILNSSDTTTEQKYAMTAYYNYYQAAENY